MIPDINRGNDLSNALHYNMNKVENGVAKILDISGIYVPPNRDATFSDLYDSINSYIQGNPKLKNTVLHISLNPHPDDRITEKTATQIAKEYIEKMGWNDQPYVIFKHEDIDRRHIHIVTTDVDSLGKKIKDSNERYRSMKIARGLEKRYNLHPAFEKKVQQLNQCKPVNYKSSNLKNQILAVLKDLKRYKFQTMGEYQAMLHFFNVDVTHVKGEYKGEPYNGLVYSAINDKGEKIGKPLKSSLYGKAYGYDATINKMEASKKLWKGNDFKTSCKDAIKKSLSETQGINNFRSKLKELGVDVLFRKNIDNRIFGVTFIDHNNQYSINGSRLGKDFSANFFNEYFSDEERKGYTNLFERQIEQGILDEKTPTVEYYEENVYGFDFLDTIVDIGAASFGSKDIEGEKAERKLYAMGKYTSRKVKKRRLIKK